MATNKRQQIMTALKSALATITTANGYESDFTSSQIREWDRAAIDFQSNTVAPVDSDYISIQDSADNIETRTIEIDEHTLTVDIEMYAVGTDAHTKFRKFAADLITFTRLNRSLSGLIEDMELDSADETNIFANTRKTILYKRVLYITYITLTNNAYN